MEVLFPGVDVIHHQGVVIPTMMAIGLIRSSADQVEFLLFSQLKPGPGKVKCRTWDGLQLQNILVKLATRLHVGDVDGDVIELGEVHE